MVTVNPWPKFSPTENVKNFKPFMDEKVRGWDNIVNEIESRLLDRGMPDRGNYGELDFNRIINVIEASGIRDAVSAEEGKDFEISRRALNSNVERFAIEACQMMAIAKTSERVEPNQVEGHIRQAAGHIISGVAECSQEKYDSDLYWKIQEGLVPKVVTALKEKYWEENPRLSIQTGEVLPLPDAYVRDYLAAAELVNKEPSAVAPERFRREVSKQSGSINLGKEIEKAQAAFNALPKSSQDKIIQQDWATAIKVDESVEGAVARISAAKKAPPSRG